MATETTTTDAANEPKLIQLDEATLMRLLHEARMGGSYLPPGAFRGEDGVVYRTVREATGRYRSIRDANDKEIRREEIVRQRRRLVRLVADPSPVGLLEVAKYCKRHASDNGPDFFHPQLGWIRNGSKREVDVAENLGTGAQNFTLEYIEIPREDNYGEATATLAGVDQAELSPDDDDATARATPAAPVATDGAAEAPSAAPRRKAS